MGAIRPNSSCSQVSTADHQPLQPTQKQIGTNGEAPYSPGFPPVSPDALARIQALYDAGLYVQAYSASQAFGPLKHWRGQSASTLAARLAFNLGGYRIGRALHWFAYRSDPRNPDHAAFHAYTVLNRRGPLAAWKLLEEYGTPPDDASGERVAHFCTVRASVAASLRDFPAADHWLQQADLLAPNDPWVATSRSHVLEAEDAYEDALAAAKHALQLRPWFRPGVQALAHALQLLDRDEEALATLTEASGHLECLHVARQLAALQQEMGHYADSAANLARLPELAPLMEKPERLWLERQRIALDCLRRDTASALAGAKRIEEPYYQELAQRLKQGTSLRRVRLEVPFVRQHHLTCAPATLSAISRYWKQPAEHLEVAEAICYDGTPAHSERAWAEGNGWAVREFTVTWDAARALLDRGVPFTLTTSEATSAHLQAVVGYDELRQTLWVRDPFTYYAAEFVFTPLLERYRSTGPRGMAMVPVARRELLENLSLPDAELYDELHAVQHGLAQHRRGDALTACRRMEAATPAHRLTLTAQHALAAYDGNTPAMLECIENLLKQYPDDANLNLRKLGFLRELARREERLELLETRVGKPGCDPVFWQQYAQELRADARQHRAAATWASWALRYRPTDPVFISSYADLLWDQRQFAKANRYYYFASCLGDKNEQFARSHFIASRHLGLTESALAFLQQRHQRLGRKSANPTITLVESLSHLGRTELAFQTVEAALQQGDRDGVLSLFGADFHGRFGRFESADRWLRQAQGRCSSGAWNRAAATLAGYQHDKVTALNHWRQVLELEPLAHDAIGAIALLLAETEGRAAAIRFLDETCEHFPFSCPLLDLRINWRKPDGAAAVIPYLRRSLEVNPANAWAWRELAWQLTLAGNGVDEALQAANEAIRIEPHRSAGYAVRAHVLTESGRAAEGHADFREAVQLEVDNDYALPNFVATAPTLTDRKQALAVVAGELRRQVIFSDALAAYREAARGVLPSQEVLALLREAHQARPDLWQSWSVLIGQLVEVGDHSEALKLAREATERFPLQPRLWVDLAQAEQALLNPAGESAALEKALEITPGYSHASRQLALIWERRHELARARAVMEHAIAANPLDPANYGGLAHILWKLGERDAAISRLQHALQLQPGYEWAWNALQRWGGEAGRPGLAADAARELTRTRAGEPRSWLILANRLSPKEAPEEFFSALDRALALNPRCEDACDERARGLALLNRFDEALEACGPTALQPPPPKLKIRAAWVEAQRGNLPKAIALAKAALAEHPDHYGGWQLLSEWYLQIQHADEAVQAAEAMARLAPLQAVPLGYLGDLKARLRDRAGAKAAFQRAFALDPDYHYAGFRLFHLQLADRELSGAAESLAVLERGGRDSKTLSCSVALAVARRQWDAAVECFRSLCGDHDAESWSIAAAAEALETQGGRRTVDGLIDKELVKPQAAPALAEVWVERQAKERHWGLHSRLKRLHANGEIGRRAVLTYLNGLGEAVSAAKGKSDVTAPLYLRYHLRRLLRQHRHWLEKDVEGWGKVGYVLTCMGRPRPVIEWLGDWRNRPNAESWMLYNLAVMLQREGRHDETRALIRHAVALPHGRDLHEIFRLWAAFEEALAGNIALAERHLATLPAEMIRDQHRPLEAMTQLLILLSQPPPQDRKTLRKAIRTRLRTAFSRQYPCHAVGYVKHGYRRFLSNVRPRVGGFWFWIWGEWFYRGGGSL